MPRFSGVVTGSGEVLDRDALFARLTGNAIIYVGESHDQATHHAIQLEVIRGLHERGMAPAIGLEMLPFTDEGPLHDYLAGRIDEAAFRTYWSKYWSDDWYDMYAPILRYAKEHDLPVHGLNVPRDIVSTIRAGGLEALSDEQRALIPDEIYPIREPRYLEYVETVIRYHNGVPDSEIPKWIMAQTVWNEAMGEQALKVREETGGRPLVVLVGMGHTFFDAGIPESVGNRAELDQSVVLPYPLGGPRGDAAKLLDELRDNPEARETAGFHWLTPAKGNGPPLPTSRRSARVN